MSKSSNGNSKLHLSAWLKERIHFGHPGITWIDQESEEFKIPWLHKSRSQRNGMDIFTAWAKHTGSYAKISGQQDKDPYSQCKANLRSALRKAPDIEFKAALNGERHYRFKQKIQNKKALEAQLLDESSADPCEQGMIVPLVVEQEFVSEESNGQLGIDAATDGSDTTNSPTQDGANGYSPNKESECYDILERIDQSKNIDPDVYGIEPAVANPYPLDAHPVNNSCEANTESGKYDSSTAMSLGSDSFDHRWMDAVNASHPPDDVGSLPYDLVGVPVQPLTCDPEPSRCSTGKSFVASNNQQNKASLASKMLNSPVQHHQEKHSDYMYATNGVNPSQNGLIPNHSCPNGVKVENMYIEVIYRGRCLKMYHAENPNGCIIAHKQVTEEQLIRTHGKNRMGEFYGEGNEGRQFIDLEPVMNEHRASFPDTKAFTKCLTRGFSLQSRDGNIILERNTSLKISVKPTLDAESHLLPSRSQQKKHIIFDARQFVSDVARSFNGKQNHPPSPSVYLCLTESGLEGEGSMELVIRVTSCAARQHMQQPGPKGCTIDGELNSLLTSLDILSIQSN